VPPKRRILCTEDDADTRDLFSTILQLAGYEAVCVDSPKEALDLARSQHFDLYLMDNWLPFITGSMLAAQIREFDDVTPILFCSGAGYESDIHDAQLAGAQGYLVKPVECDVLVAEIDRLLRRSKLKTQES
jgi:DNA-binding response OmpR family regulator